MTNVLLDAALSYAARGWQVHPCRGDKTPLTAHWRDEASVDPDQIRLWWTRWPNASVAIATGAASGLYVIDEDAAGAVDHLDLPPTLTAYTGKGKHLYFARPEGEHGVWGNSKGQRAPRPAGPLGHDVDSRGDGGYVIAPPSIHAATGTAYAWGEASEPVAPLPENVQALLRARDAPVAMVPAPTLALVSRLDSTSRIDIYERARRYLATIPGAVSGSGGHDATYRTANVLANGFALERSDVEAYMADWNRTCSPPWSERELAHKIDDAVKAGTFNGRERGCLLVDTRAPPVEPGAFGGSGAAPDSAGQLTPYQQAVADLQAVGFGSTAAAETRKLDAFTPAASLFDRVFPPTPWMVQGVLTPGSICTIGGEPKTTKTWAAIELAMAVATGTPAFGEFGVPGGVGQRVALFLTEDNEQSIRNRLLAMAGSRRMDAREACQNINVTCMQSLDLLSLDHMAALVVTVRAVGDVRMLVLDPLRNLHNAEENSSTEMNTVLGSLRALRTVLGCAVLFVHHMSKGDPTKSGKSGGQALRGSSSMHGAVDCGLYLTGLKTDEQNNWSNKAQVQIKGAKGAGRFDLALNVEDIDDEAVNATWTVDRTAQAVASAATAAQERELQDKVETALREHRAKNLGAKIPMIEAFIRLAVGAGAVPVRVALAAGVAAGTIERVMVGKQSKGYVSKDVEH